VLHDVGPDNIAGQILKENADICSDILTIIYKKSMETGQVPRCVLVPLSGISVFASDEKDDWNCLFKILAFYVGI
jgi:hypothetical protein